ncbi:MAG: thiamine-phosphate kinase [Desulfobacterales bacterium]|jgi:thiamine-monophosphate kinase|nr:thiamine-phosphate kinase [Desulfobacterales bacterium]
MGLNDIGEFGFIRRIRRGCLIRPEGVIQGIGDDAAAFRTDGRLVSLVTTDLLVERVHFLRHAISGRDLGHKSLAVNLSDIAAMGGTAREAFVSIAIPDGCELAYLEDIFQGMKDLARNYAVNILGGDTTFSRSDLIINVAVYGMVAENEMLTRAAARPGDVIFCTGCLGDSRAGLHLILEGAPVDTPELQALLAAHCRPEPHLREGRLLAAAPGVRAAIDVSDGLSSDLGHIVEESRAGARVYAARLPISDNLRFFCRRFGRSPLDYALSGGEDYTLLLTAAAGSAGAIAGAFQTAFGRPLTAIGEITDTARMELVDDAGDIAPIAPTGWDHFKRP